MPGDVRANAGGSAPQDRMTVLVLGGTAEGRRLATALHALPGLTVVSSLAGRTSAPLLPPGEVRIGGFGGAPGLAAWLRERRAGAVVDATHPFAGTISASAATACADTGTPLLLLRRPGWTARPGDVWHRVPSLPAAVAALPAIGRRALLTTGRQTLAAFAPLSDVWFLVRAVEPPAPPFPARMSVLLDRGPFTVEGERALLREHRVDVVVTKDSGSPAVAAKLDAARDLGVPVLMIDRPPAPPGVASVASVAEAVAWVSPPGSGAA
ncbi:cobalt-precorrin-6A reductase [Catenuloplanes atrovinosus]|uniref:Precorrin-6A/cobalt-precorrin-6A reductase n=1 Tax=Catenuloplanes atrovinosus TaxID=137266 RepID=A0AAE4C959_9ACTN|nr:cobalt-precorrin-6A reductase [Catenuloplanes atrovinosus]MDR7274484.1 precorrin-6A/cobalt-precorrin-6A reductase [Catenuloplanes atrovinosus]